jgi:hypothetical protein
MSCQLIAGIFVGSGFVAASIHAEEGSGRCVVKDGSETGLDEAGNRLR